MTLQKCGSFKCSSCQSSGGCSMVWRILYLTVRHLRVGSLGMAYTYPAWGVSVVCLDCKGDATCLEERDKLMQSFPRFSFSPTPAFGKLTGPLTYMKPIYRLGVLLLILSIVPSVAMAMGGKCGKDLRWTLNDGKLVISGEGAMSDFSRSNQPWRIALVKEVILEQGMTSIGDNAFAGAKITSISIPDGVTEIGENAFRGCGSLMTAILPYGMKRIEKGAFAKCSSLIKVNIPTTVELIGEDCFAKCSMLTSISLPAQIKTVGTGAFAGCAKLSEIGMLPDFINRNNAAQFGLTYADVDAFQSKNHSVSVTAVNQTPVGSTKKNEDTPRVSVGSGRPGDMVPAYGTADIDIEVPQRPTTSVNTFAIIFANEHYSTIADVPFAINDGKSVQAYFHNTLGLPMENIKFYPDATLGHMRAALAYIKEVDHVYNDDMDLIVYYAGHGAPDENTKEAFLVPTDAYKVHKDVCLPLSEFYQTLGELKANSVKVFLDACFSGAVRSGDMIAENRGAAMSPRKSQVMGNVAVVSATTDDQTAWQYTKTGHGLFTYYLLKKLQETKGEASMGEIVDYLQEKVARKSIVENQRVQTPTASASSAVDKKWRSWSLK